jgi:hypothetical protein
VAVGFGVRELVVNVLPSASPLEGGGLILIALIAVLFAVWAAIASVAAIPRRVARSRRLPSPARRE